MHEYFTCDPKFSISVPYNPMKVIISCDETMSCPQKFFPTATHQEIMEKDVQILDSFLKL